MGLVLGPIGDRPCGLDVGVGPGALVPGTSLEPGFLGVTLVLGWVLSLSLQFLWVGLVPDFTRAGVVPRFVVKLDAHFTLFLLSGCLSSHWFA